MIRSRFAKGLAAAVLSASAFSHAQADVVGYTFTDTANNTRSESAATPYLNPKNGMMRFFVSSGIDRRIDLTVARAAGGVIYNQRSALIGANDRFTFNNGSYYGHAFNVDALTDGQYVARVKIQTASGSVIHESEQSFTVDTTPPVISRFEAQAEGMGSGVLDGSVITGSVWKMGITRHEGISLLVSGINDTLSPVESLHVYTYRQDGSLYGTKEVEIDHNNRQGRIMINQSGVFPNSDLDEVFQLEVRVKDAAGNEYVSPRQKAMYDNIANPPPVFGVYDPHSSNVLGPGLSKFVPYTPGMQVKTNPIRLAFRVPKSNWHEHREGGLRMINSLGELNKVGQDANYVYLTTTSPFGNVDHNYWRWINFGAWGGGGVSYDLKLAPGVADTPRMTDVKYLYSDIGWDTFYRYHVQNTSLPVTVSRIRVEVEPRPYAQVAHHNGTCTVPAGGTSCIINYSYTMSKGTTGYLHANATVFNQAGTLRSPPRWAEVQWNDLHYPSLSHQYDPKNHALTLYVHQPARGAYFDRLRLKDAWIETTAGQRLDPEGGMTANNWEYYTYTWDLRTLPEGQYALRASAQEMHGPTRKLNLFTYTSDRTAPVISLNTRDNDSIRSLDDIVINLDDNFDPNPSITSIVLEGGPTSDRVQMPWRKDGQDFRLEYPVMFPSLEAGEEYTLTVYARDQSANASQTSVTFIYNPDIVGIIGDDGQGVRIPAVVHPFTRPDGLQIATTPPLTLQDGSVVEGVYDVYATLRSDSDIPLYINGILIQPGATMTVLPAHDFSAHGGRINIPISAAESGTEGRAKLLLSTVAPNAPIVLADIVTWTPNLSLKSDSWTVFPALEKFALEIDKSESDCAALTYEPAVARLNGHPLKDPTCLVKWIRNPREIYEVVDTTTKEAVGLEGFLTDVGRFEFSANVYLVDPNGQEFFMQSLAQEVDVVIPEGSVKVEIQPQPDSVERRVEELRLGIKQTAGPDCSLITVDLQMGLDRAARGQPACYLEWTELPEGLAQYAWSGSPDLRGVVQSLESESETVTLRLNAISPAGIQVPMGDFSASFDVVDPDMPTFELEDRNRIAEDLYIAPVEGGYVTDYIMTGRPVDITMREYHNDVLKNEDGSIGYFTRENRTQRRLIMDPSPIWTYNEVRLDAEYNVMPGKAGSKDVQVLSVPNLNIRPYVEVDVAQVLNIETLPVTVNIRDMYNIDKGFLSDEMGQWDVQLVNYMSTSKQEPLTDFKPVDENGSASFEVDPMGIEATGFRLAAIARLQSPEEVYQRTEISPRPFYIALLRGEAIDASVKGLRISGPAPLNFIGSLELMNRLDFAALGEVHWEVRREGANKWDKIEVSGTNLTRIIKVFDTGRYELRARLINKNSNAESVTETVHIHAFDVPNVSLEGPQNVFVGDTGRYRLNAVLEGESIPEDQMEVIWSIDDGETWTPGTSEYTITSDEFERITLRGRVRLKTSDAEAEEAWVERRARVSFRPVLPARTSIIGPRVVETGSERQWRAVVQTPFRNMDVEVNGYFVLPDGSEVPGTDLTYLVMKDSDELFLTLKYVSWIEGFEETLQESLQRVRIWEYEWPIWDFYARSTAQEAPAFLNLRIRSIGSRARHLEGLDIQWDLPPEASEVVANTSDSRGLRFESPGTYNIRANITDERGNHSSILYTFELREQTPWDVDFSLNPSNAFSRAPLTVGFRPDISGGHPRDRIIDHRYYLNGELIEEGVRYGSLTLPQGEHTVALEAVSEFGHVVRKEEAVTVVPNKPPVCELTSRDLSSSWRLYASCHDEDGIVRGHEWYLDGELIGISGSRISITNREGEGGKPDVILIGVDDSGDKSAPVHW